MQTRAAAIRDDDARMPALQLARRCYTAGMSNYTDIMHHVFHIALYAHGFILWREPALQAFLMRGDAGGAGVFIALHGLNAAQRKHETARRNNKIRTHAQRPCHARRRNQFARTNHPHTIAQPIAHQMID